MTYPSRFGLILEGLLRILRGSLNVVHRVFHVVFDPVDHLALEKKQNMRSISKGDIQETKEYIHNCFLERPVIDTKDKSVNKPAFVPND